MKHKKRFGQHFLHDPGYLHQIIQAAGGLQGVPVMEIGPGAGALTAPLLKQGALVTALEVDRDWAGFLRAQFAQQPHFTLVEGDATHLDWEPLLSQQQGWKAVANLPYNLSSPLLFLYARHRRHFQSLVLMLQKEVAERIAWQPGDAKGDYGSLSIAMDLFFQRELLFTLPPSAFDPPPLVESSVIRLVPKPPLLTEPEERVFLALVKSCFLQRRKLFKKNLEAGHPGAWARLPPDLQAAHGNRRPEDLSPAEFLQLFQALVGT